MGWQALDMLPMCCRVKRENLESLTNLNPNHIFGVWEEAGVPTENLCRCNMLFSWALIVESRNKFLWKLERCSEQMQRKKKSKTKRKYNTISWHAQLSESVWSRPLHLACNDRKTYNLTDQTVSAKQSNQTGKVSGHFRLFLYNKSESFYRIEPFYYINILNNMPYLGISWNTAFIYLPNYLNLRRH